jgi:hypothetical protein
MNFMRIERLVLHCVLSGLLAGQVLPQNVEKSSGPRDVFSNGVPSYMSPQVNALGDRVSQPGKDMTILNGEFTGQSGRPATVSVIVQLPQSVEIRGLKSGGNSLRFDNASPAIPTDPDDAVLLETFTTDTVEGMLASIKDGAEVRILGYGVLLSGPLKKDFPIQYDVFEVHSPVKTRSDQILRVKRFYFDSATGYLARTSYEDGRHVVEVKFSGWHKDDGAAYPGRIERYEDSQLLFSFDIKNVAARPQSGGVTNR